MTPCALLSWLVLAAVPALADEADPRRPGDWELLIRSSARWIPHDWSPDGQRFVVSRYVSINESYAFVFDMPTKSLKALPVPAGTKGTSANGKMAIAADGRTHYLTPITCARPKRCSCGGTCSARSNG